MAYGPYSTNVIQLGRETTPGTAVPATTVWRGPAIDIEDARERQFVESHIGILAPTSDHYDSSLLARLAFPETELTFEQFCHVLEAGIAAATPTGSGPYTRDYALPVGSTPNALKLYTLEGGNKSVGDGHRMAYSFVESFKLSGRANEAWKLSSTWAGRRKTSQALTGSLAVPAQEVALFNNSRLYIDATGGSWGTTPVTGAFKRFEIDVDTGWRPVFSGDGELYFHAIKYVGAKINFSFALELENSSTRGVSSERTAYENGVIRLIQVAIPGTSGRAIMLQGCGKYTAMGGYENDNGNTIVAVEGEARYSSADASFWGFQDFNNVATLP
jgi:hypothetical protein